MPYDEEQNKTTIRNLQLKQNELARQIGEIRTVSGKLTELLTEKVLVKNTDGSQKYDETGERMSTMEPPMDKGTDKRITVARRNDIFETFSTKATSLLA